MRTVRKPWVAIILGSLGLAFLSGAGGIGVTHSRPQERCGLPMADYVATGNPRSPALAVSQTAILIPAPSGIKDTAGERIVYYQLNTAKMTVDQCSISRVALTLSDRGWWKLSLRADQNAAGSNASSPVLGAGPITLQTAYIKRNEFIVRIRGYSAYQVNANDADTSPGRPLLFDLCPPPFWVQRGEPRFIDCSGVIPLGKNAGLVDRIEVEFRYR